MGNQRNRTSGRRKGASVVEYGVVVGLIAVGAIAIVATMGGSVRDVLGGDPNAKKTGADGRPVPNRSLELTASSAPPVLEASALRPAVVGASYYQELSATASGGGPLSWSLDSGALPSGLSLSGASIFGTPSSEGASAFVLRAFDAGNGTSASRGYAISVQAGVPAIGSDALPPAVFGLGYFHSLSGSAAGGGGVAWSLTGGSLPSWLSLNAAGTLSGTPDSTAASSFELTAASADGKSTSKPYSISVSATPPAVSTAFLPDAQPGREYSQTLSAATTPSADGVEWSLAAGALPPGLRLDSNGTVSGTPTQEGLFSPTFRAEDKRSRAASVKPLALAVFSQAPAILTPSLQAAAPGAAYGQTLSARLPSSSPPVWSIVTGSLPSGVALDAASGILSGTPAEAGEHPIVVQALDPATKSAVQSSFVFSVAKPVVVRATVSADQADVDYRVLLLGAGWNGVSPVAGIVTVLPRADGGPSLLPAPTLSLNGFFPPGSSITFEGQQPAP